MISRQTLAPILRLQRLQQTRRLGQRRLPRLVRNLPLSLLAQRLAW